MKLDKIKNKHYELEGINIIYYSTFFVTTASSAGIASWYNFSRSLGTAYPY